VAAALPTGTAKPEPATATGREQVTRHVRLREFLVAVEGLALFRTLVEGGDETAEARIDEVRRIVGEDGTYGLGTDVPELDPRTGYARWSATYDRPGNPLISVEQPVVWALLDALPRGHALDAACGTGRHAAHLAELGHEVTGVDGSPEMLEIARARDPSTRFLEAICTHSRSRTASSMWRCARWPSVTVPTWRLRSPSSHAPCAPAARSCCPICIR
jgi:hypothetical protein